MYALRSHYGSTLSDRATADKRQASGVCEPSSTCIKGGLGSISSSRCQTTRAPDEPGRREIFSLLDEQSAIKGDALKVHARRRATPWPLAGTRRTEPQAAG
jgi:hypothetical protein